MSLIMRNNSSSFWTESFEVSSGVSTSEISSYSSTQAGQKASFQCVIGAGDLSELSEISEDNLILSRYAVFDELRKQELIGGDLGWSRELVNMKINNSSLRENGA